RRAHRAADRTAAHGFERAGHGRRGLLRCCAPGGGRPGRPVRAARHHHARRRGHRRARRHLSGFPLDARMEAGGSVSVMDAQTGGGARAADSQTGGDARAADARADEPMDVNSQTQTPTPTPTPTGATPPLAVERLVMAYDDTP